MAGWKPATVPQGNVRLTDSQALSAFRLCNAAQDCSLQGKILRDIAAELGLVFPP
jgi:hypothetical protein